MMHFRPGPKTTIHPSQVHNMPTNSQVLSQPVKKAHEISVHGLVHLSQELSSWPLIKAAIQMQKALPSQHIPCKASVDGLLNQNLEAVD